MSDHSFSIASLPKLSSELLERLQKDIAAGAIAEDCWNELIAQAYQAGADQELEACCDHIRDHYWGFVDLPDGTKMHRAVYLKQARRPKPLSLKKQSLALIDLIQGKEKVWHIRDLDFIRRALEALPND
jgi:hypothetical protein